MIEWVPFSAKSLDFINNSNARLNIAHGAVRSAKTISCTVRWLDYLVSGPPGDLAMLGRTNATLQRNVLNDIFDIIGPKNYKWINRQQGEVRIFNRRVYCFGANNEDAESKIRGATFAGTLCDEVSLYPQSVFNQLMARMSVSGAMCFCNTNPDSPFHWFYTDYITNEAITNKKVWQFLMEDNLSNDQEYMDSLKQMYRGVWYDRMIKGEWVAAEGRIYDMFDPMEHNVDALYEIQLLTTFNKLHPLSLKWFVACDYGTSTVMSWGLYCKIPLGAKDMNGNHVGGRVYKVKEFYYDAARKGFQHTDSEFGKLFDEWIEDIYNKLVLMELAQEGHYKSLIRTIYVDPSAASWKLELMRKGYSVLDAKNDVINGIRYVASQLHSKQFLMDHSCEYTRKEYTSYVWDSQAQLQGKDKPLKVRDHTPDTDRYGLYTESLGALTGVYGISGR